ncbi:unknown [Collinsella sp. CAG:398]|nr:unknown [Collinsella sp. CAG:398]
MRVEVGRIALDVLDLLQAHALLGGVHASEVLLYRRTQAIESIGPCELVAQLEAEIVGEGVVEQVEKRSYVGQGKGDATLVGGVEAHGGRFFGRSGVTHRETLERGARHLGRGGGCHHAARRPLACGHDLDRVLACEHDLDRVVRGVCLRRACERERRPLR